MEKTKGFCWGCGLAIEGAKHYHDTVPAGSDLRWPKLTCREENKVKHDAQRHAVKRRQSASLNQGQPVGKHNKELANRIEKLTVRSRSEVARLMNISVEGVRVIEMRAMNKLRVALFPFKGALTGENKVRQIQSPIPSLED